MKKWIIAVMVSTSIWIVNWCMALIKRNAIFRLDVLLSFPKGKQNGSFYKFISHKYKGMKVHPKLLKWKINQIDNTFSVLFTIN